MKRSWPKTKWVLVLIATGFAGIAFAQNPAVTGGATVTSEPGQAAATRVVKVTAQVIGIDKAARTVKLKGPQGNVADVVAGDEVRNFNQIKLGDFVVVRYAEALSLELRKAKTTAGEPTVREGTARAKAGERPAVAGARRVTAIAEVTDVDPKNSTITLKGPRGNVVTLDVRNRDQFKVVRKGDQVEVTYTEALALSVEPAPKPK